MSNPLDLYEDHVDLKRSGVFTAGKEIKEVASLSDLLNSRIPVLREWALDNDLQYIQICSTNIGMIRTYQKRYRRGEK